MAVEMLGSLPKHYKDILKIRKEDQEPWMIAMKEEIKSLHERKYGISLTYLKVVKPSKGDGYML